MPVKLEENSKKTGVPKGEKVVTKDQSDSTSTSTSQDRTANSNPTPCWGKLSKFLPPSKDIDPETWIKDMITLGYHIDFC